MSGIVCVLNRDGRPVEPPVLQAMTDCMAFRGPDATDIWQDGPIGLGHTLFATTFESQREVQPTSLDGVTWITADARIDGRGDLRKALTTSGRQGVDEATDVELILHAYAVWGRNCIDHLIGDFAFAIWDASEQRLFCARDHFGLKQLFYAVTDEVVIASNTLNAIRKHPDITAELDELAVADFLVYGAPLDPDVTTFKQIRSLLPGHFLVASPRGIDKQMYWELPTDGEIRYPNHYDYVDHFREIFDAAIGDRLRRDSVTIELSGGMDSASIAATAAVIAPDCELLGRTSVYDRLIPDEEREWSSYLAKELGIRHRIIAMDDLEMFEDWANPDYATPEPSIYPWSAMQHQSQLEVTGTPVILNGTGGDPLLYPSRTFPGRMVRQGRLGFLLRGIMDHVRLTGRFPRPYIRSSFRQRAPGGSVAEPSAPNLPSWLARDLVEGLGLVSRARDISVAPERDGHPMRPEAYASLDRLFWKYEFRNADAQSVGKALEWRYPFFDVRLMSYVLAIPPLPWFENKLILRLSMAERLPEAVRTRPKTPLQGTPIHRMAASLELSTLAEVLSVPGVDHYVDRQAALEAIAPHLRSVADPDTIRMAMAPFCLAIWLRHATIP